MPSVAVDSTTGTLAVSFYDGRYDAARARVATTITTSIDGGQTFSAQNNSFVNTPNAPFDQISRTFTNLGPIPDNLSAGNPLTDFIREGAPGLGFGDRQGLAFESGHIYTAWSGNENGGTRASICSTSAWRAPIRRRDHGSSRARWVPSRRRQSMARSSTPTFAADGAPKIDGFSVTFDRPVDTRTFTKGQVKVYFRNPSDATGTLGQLIAVLDPVPLDPSGPLVAGKQIRATTFFVPFDPSDPSKLSRVGTYSYEVGPGVLDFGGLPITTVTPDATSTTVSSTTVAPYVAPSALPATIPSGQTVDLPLDVNGYQATDTIASLDVNLSITAQHTSNLQLYLVAPDQTTVLLSNHEGTGKQLREHDVHRWRSGRDQRRRQPVQRTAIGPNRLWRHWPASWSMAPTSCVSSTATALRRGDAFALKSSHRGGYGQRPTQDFRHRPHRCHARCCRIPDDRNDRRGHGQRHD